MVTRIENKKLSKSSSAWMQEHIDDPYVKKAQIDGYRARAAYKLLEINEKTNLIKKGMTVVDLGSAPGSWSQVAGQLVGEKGVLIVGCGPAGLTLARQLAAFTDIKTCIVEQKSGPLLFGQADGISCRTMEIMEAFNSSALLVKEMYQLYQNAFWEPDAEQPDHIRRSHKVADARLGLSEFIHGVVNQARLHDILLDGMAHSETHLLPHYNRHLLELKIDPLLTQDLDAYPVTATFERNDADGPADCETVRARYVVGCDGARSAVRKQLSIVLEGDSANKAWGAKPLGDPKKRYSIRFYFLSQ